MILRPRAPARAVAALAAAAIPCGCALVAGLSDHQPYPVVQITAGADHACLLLDTGEVWCWGDNTYGQLGPRTVNDGACASACPAAPVAGVSGAAQVSAGDGFTCAALTRGTVQCWGRDGSAELGGTAKAMCNGVPCSATPVEIAGVAGAVQVSAGSRYACARTSAGSVMCWGDNGSGQLGTGNVVTPAQAVTVAGLGHVVDVSAALVGASTCAAGDTGVWCWGNNVHGGTGHAPGTEGDTTEMGAPASLRPTLVPGISGAVLVRAGDYGACAGLSSGTFACWGYDGIGALGTKATTNVVAPAPITAVSTIAALDLRADHTCVADGNADAWCWGASGLGALGTENGTLGTPCDQGTRCQRTAQRVGLGSVSRIAVGTALSVALLADGTVVAWGMNDKGQLGHRPGSAGDGPCPASSGDTCDGTPAHVVGPPPP